MGLGVGGVKLYREGAQISESPQNCLHTTINPELRNTSRGGEWNFFFCLSPQQFWSNIPAALIKASIWQCTTDPLKSPRECFEDTHPYIVPLKWKLMKGENIKNKKGTNTWKIGGQRINNLKVKSITGLKAGFSFINDPTACWEHRADTYHHNPVGTSGKQKSFSEWAWQIKHLSTISNRKESIFKAKCYVQFAFMGLRAGKCS